MPAETESTTVSTMTTRPSLSERLKAAPMSTMPVPENTLPNHTSETPFIGKVRPPSGPWNDRM